MAERLIIDADSHVEEVDETWDYLDERHQQRRPQAITLKKLLDFRQSQRLQVHRWDA
jgi:hypothetical protein